MELDTIPPLAGTNRLNTSATTTNPKIQADRMMTDGVMNR